MMARLSQSQNAQIIALKALTFLGNSEDSLERFVVNADMQPKDLAARVQESGVQSAILVFLLADEALLQAFCRQESIQPRDIHLAKHQLDGSRDDE